MDALIKNFPGGFLTLIVFVAFCHYILKMNHKLNAILSFLVLFFSSLILDVFYLFEFPILRTLAGILMCYLILVIIFKCYNKNVLILIIYYILLLSSEVIFFLIVSSLFKISGNDIYIKFSGTFLGNVLVSFFCIFLGCLFRKIINQFISINIKNKVIIYWIFVIGVILLFWLIIFSNKSLNVETFLILIIMCLLLVIIFFSIYQTYKNEQLIDRYDKLLEFIKKYEIEIDNQRVLRHETKNQLLIIKSKLIDNDDLESVVSYINEVLKDNSKKVNHSEYAKMKCLPSNGIKGLFYLKVSEAIDNGLIVNINISKDVETSFLKDLSGNMFNHIGKILGIFLDNAIEGASESVDKKIGIEIYMNREKVIFIISNSYLFNSISKLNSFNRSSKGISRGHGLLLAKTIINSNSKLFNKTEITDKLYIQRLEVKK